ncbi:MAG: xanthine dehydrogenase family protein molybdopterin-binding subunit, partial [Clostridia bacterium]|nr:xanthine dehydrogenase family protein molybdopterin-binding subunit [Clostridia bacterium]
FLSLCLSAAPGVAAVVTGSHDNRLTGVLLQDRPPLAIGRVRYMGEPVAAVIAGTEAQAQAAARLIEIEIEPLPCIGSIAQATSDDAAIIHPDAKNYASLVDDVKPEPGTNIAASFRIRKGDTATIWDKCAHVAHERFFIPQAEHLAMEVRCAESELKADGTMWIRSATQSPFTVRKLVAGMLDMDPGMIQVETTLLGGAFGGKSAVQLEYIAALCAMAVPGRRVNLVLTREQDMASCPCKLGLEADIKLGCDAEGKFVAGEMTYWLDCGAYSDISPNMSKAIAVDCSGPYRIDNLSCDSLCVYTNHTYSTAYRGFAHEAYTYCLERIIDVLADMAGADPMTMRRVNAIMPGNYSPTQVEITLSNAGNIAACIDGLKQICRWNEGFCQAFPNGKIRAKGLGCFWKTPNPSLDASAGAVITFNPDGSCNLLTGVVEMGNAGKTHLCQMVAEKLRMDYDRVHVVMSVDTRTTPEYFKTVASLSSFLAGRAALNAADDAIRHMKKLAAIALRCETDELDYGEERVFLISNPKFAIGYQDLVGGLAMQDGNNLGQPVIGRGSSVMRHIGALSEDTGKGKVGHAWTVGAQAVEVEYDPGDMSYRLLNAWTVIDAGAIIDEASMRSMIMGGMSMGLSMARGEMCAYSPDCLMENTSMRTYKASHIGEEPRYQVEFVTTPQLDAPFAARSYTEHGIIAMPAALGNALSRAVGKKLNMLPLTNESLWIASGKGVGQ